MADWQTALAADGEKLAEWLEKTYPGLCQHAATSRRMSDWRRGARADFFAVDRLITRHGGHVSDVPEEFWLDGPARLVNSGGLKPSKQRRYGVIPPKDCELCGKQIPWVTEKGNKVSPGRYLKKRYCTPECQWKSLHPHKKQRVRLAA